MTRYVDTMRSITDTVREYCRDTLYKDYDPQYNAEWALACIGTSLKKDWDASKNRGYYLHALANTAAATAVQSAAHLASGEHYIGITAIGTMLIGAGLLVPVLRARNDEPYS